MTAYPRRAEAVFTDENDHNPLVAQDCAICHGSGKQCVAIGEDYVLGQCAGCRGSGVTGASERYFTSMAPEVLASTDADGWVRCPSCDWRFATSDRSAWTGRRHVRCGQKIRIDRSG